KYNDKNILLLSWYGVLPRHLTNIERAEDTFVKHDGGILSSPRELDAMSFTGLLTLSQNVYLKDYVLDRVMTKSKHKKPKRTTVVELEVPGFGWLSVKACELVMESTVLGGQARIMQAEVVRVREVLYDEVDRCPRHGHPTQMCETKSCLKYAQIHDGRCEDWRAFQEIKKLPQQGGLAGSAVKLLSPPNRDSVRVGLRRPSELCVLAYVDPELRNQNQDNLQCMTSLIDHEPVPLECTRTWYSRPPLPAEPEGPAQFKLNFGERYGWWAHHDEKEDKQQAATVHGAVNDFRAQILLDTEATVSMISLDLARRLKLRLISDRRSRCPAYEASRLTSPQVRRSRLRWEDVLSTSWMCG
ncbi:Hypothetical protein PHPALM_6421, partial [Phytophthora palmivora]